MYADVRAKAGEDRDAGFMEINEYFQENPPAIFLVDPHQLHAMKGTIKWNATEGIRNYSYADIVPAN